MFLEYSPPSSAGWYGASVVVAAICFSPPPYLESAKREVDRTRTYGADGRECWWGDIAYAAITFSLSALPLRRYDCSLNWSTGDSGIREGAPGAACGVR